jgi:two-component system response regulator HydG
MKKILIVEDDVSLMLTLEKWFKENGYIVHTASSVSSAKNLLNETSIDLLLTDLRLPDGTGIELLQWKNSKHLSLLPCILMTNYAEIQLAVEAIKLGAVDFLEKPISVAVLKQKVDDALAFSSKNAYSKEPVALINPEDEKQKIIAAIEHSAGNKTLAAKFLGIDRKTLYNKIHQYDIEL